MRTLLLGGTLLLAHALAACGGTGSTTTHPGPDAATGCTGAAPQCADNCNASGTEAPTCTDGHWECPPVPGCVREMADAGHDASSGDASTTLASLDSPCGSITPNQLIALVQSSYAATYTPGTTATGYTSKNPTTASALTVGAAYTNGALTCTPGACPCDPPGPCGSCNAPPTLSVGLAVTFKTADGVFNEQFTAAARASSGEARVEWQGTVLAPDIKGTFVPTYDPNEQVIFEGQFQGTSTTGIVDEVVPNKISAGGGQW